MSTSISKAKRGRKAKPFIFQGRVIEGLRKRPVDGKWELRDGRMFSEPDDGKAVERFYQMTGQALTVDTLPVEYRKYLGKQSEQDHINWLVDALQNRRQWLAKETGIEQLGYLTDVQAPAVLPTFAELEKLWIDNATCEQQEKLKVLAGWKKFIQKTAIKEVRDITDTICKSYRKIIWDSVKGAKYQQHLFNQARRMLSNAIYHISDDKGQALDELRNIHSRMAVMTPNDTTTSINPKPISVADFQKLLSKATGDDRAYLLLMLNCALYSKECIDLSWDSIVDGCLVAHRKKKGKFLRVSVLWPETLKALSEIPKRGESIFYGENTGKPLTSSGAGKRFRELRKLAELDHIESNQIRDGASQAAAEANVGQDLYNYLMGHRMPSERDKYVKRNPTMLAPVNSAIYAKYFGK